MRFKWYQSLIIICKNVFTVAVSKPAILSTIFYPAYQKASNAVDNVINCTSGLLTAHSQEEFEPWLKIELQAKYDVKKVTIFNRQDSYGKVIYKLFVPFWVWENRTRRILLIWKKKFITFIQDTFRLTWYHSEPALVKNVSQNIS